MGGWEIVAILAAAVAAGAINAVVGSGSLITFPTLIAFGFAPVVANAS
ncbi:MAG: sulfite exporter TauE/SafE family protein, partial [Nocardiopsaceae bacterium]|nr:sulfite exporter TauE/SafE family protein [Nocardiopsaceae bacterium]